MLKPQLSPKAQTKLQAKFSLSQQFVQAQKLLQINQQDLSGIITRQLDENPFLEEVIENDTHPNSDTHLSSDLSNDYLNGLSKNFSSSSLNSLSDIHTSDIIEKTTAHHTPSLSEDLMEQLALKFNEKDLKFKIGEEIIGLLSDDGFFQPSYLVVIAKTFKVTPAVVEEVWKAIKCFEPPGIASQDLKECLLIQLEQLEQQADFQKKSTSNLFTIEKRIITDAFDELKKKNIAAIAKKIKISLDEANQAVNNIAQLNPKPTNAYQESQNNYLTPDAVILKRPGSKTLEILINREFIPQIRFVKERVEEWKNAHLKQKSPSEFKKYLQEKEQEAKSTIENLKYRETNLMKVLKKLLTVQSEFFNRGFDHLKPYSQTELAKELNLDVGTLSRLVTQKYISTQWGLISIRRLFTTAIQKNNVAKEDAVSSTKIKNLIEKIIREFPEKKLSDSKITKIIQNQGYQISRRTVNKYRNSLNLTSSYHRN